LADISKINGVPIANIEKLDAVLAANIAKVNGLVFSTAAAFLLDTYTGAGAGYSVRRLATSATNLMRIREDAGDTETDIGYDSNNELDTAAIATHCGTANGYVVTWYDQSGNGNHADQATDTSQPQIYNGTAVVTRDAFPVVDFSSVSNGMDVSLTNSDGNLSIFCGGYFPGTGQNNWIFVADNNAFSSTDGIALIHDGIVRFYRNAYTLQAVSATSAGRYLISNIFDSGTGSTIRSNGTTANQDTTSLGTTAWSYSGTSKIMSVFGGTGGEVHEIILYHSDETSNRTGIETDINGYFSIF